jgi:hypothetical protein
MWNMNVLNCTAVFISRATQQHMAGHILSQVEFINKCMPVKICHHGVDQNKYSDSPYPLVKYLYHLGFGTLQSGKNLSEFQRNLLSNSCSGFNEEP